MSALLNSFVADAFAPPVRPLSIAVVYEDAETHHLAVAVYEFLLHDLGEAADLTATWWRTALLLDPKLSDGAVRAVAKSDLVVLSVHGDRSPSSSLQTWIGTWPTATRGVTGLLAVFLPHGHEWSQTQWDSFLRDTASRKNMVYLPSSAVPVTALLGRETPFHRMHVGSSELETSRSVEPYVHWGLNE